MERIEYLTKTMSRKQKEVYSRICELKQFRAVGPVNKTCKILVQFGLIKQSTDSDNKNDYVLNGSPVQIPVIKKLPLKKELVQEIKEAPKRPWVVINETIEDRDKPKLKRPPAIYNNICREDHINKWLSVDVAPGEKEMVKVKCLQDWQMKYIMVNHKEKTAQQMAEHLRVEKYMVNLFCQVNDIEPLPPPKKKVLNKRDAYHLVPQKKTA